MEDADERALESAGAGRTIVLPNDPFWLLRVRVPADGGQVPFHIQLLYRWQYGDTLPSDTGERTDDLS